MNEGLPQPHAAWLYSSLFKTGFKSIANHINQNQPHKIDVNRNKGYDRIAYSHFRRWFKSDVSFSTVSSQGWQKLLETKPNGSDNTEINFQLTVPRRNFWGEIEFQENTFSFFCPRLCQSSFGLIGLIVKDRPRATADKVAGTPLCSLLAHVTIKEKKYSTLSTVLFIQHVNYVTFLQGFVLKSVLEHGANMDPGVINLNKWVLSIASWISQKELKKLLGVKS